MHPTTLTLRHATAADVTTIDRLALYEEAAPLTGDVLLAERGGAVIAAFSPADDRAVADIFVATAGAVRLLRGWAAELCGPAPRRVRRLPRLPFARPAVVR